MFLSEPQAPPGQWVPNLLMGIFGVVFLILFYYCWKSLRKECQINKERRRIEDLYYEGLEKRAKKMLK